MRCPVSTLWWSRAIPARAPRRLSPTYARLSLRRCRWSSSSGTASSTAGPVLDETRRARAIAPDYGITLLDDGQAFIGDVRFIGGTLWADFRLHGEAAQAEAIAAAAGHGDHVRIALTRIPYRRFTPLDAVNRFEATSAYLSTRLGERFDRPTVVVTHHAPSARSLDPRLLGAGRDASYASSLDRMIVGVAPALWLHGHVHRSCDYGLCRTRIVCNAKVLISTEI